jgi:hypothetical protein
VGEIPIYCFQGTHLILTVISGVAIAFYLPLSIRLNRVEARLDGLEVRSTAHVVVPCYLPYWKEDSAVDLPYKHPLSDQNSLYKVFTVVAKAVCVSVTTLIPGKTKLVAFVLVCVGFILFCVSIKHAPFFSLRANSIRTGLDLSLLWSYGYKLGSVYLPCDPTVAECIDAMPFGLLPAFLVGFTIRHFPVWCKCGKRYARVSPDEGPTTPRHLQNLPSPLGPAKLVPIQTSGPRALPTLPDGAAADRKWFSAVTENHGRVLPATPTPDPLAVGGPQPPARSAGRVRVGRDPQHRPSTPARNARSNAEIPRSR